MTRKEIRALAHELRALLKRMDDVPATLSASAARDLRAELEEIAQDLRERIAVLDPVKQPTAYFDPADPRLFGTFAAIALIGQDRLPLESAGSRKFYGSGIYAVYYGGSIPLYAPIAGTENPIYVGKADPAIGSARTPREQMARLARRLEEHRKNIGKATNLKIADFDCRYLVVASGWQSAAESALIDLFKPVWNSETKILYGFGKHGDSGDTRRNKRSPWDVLHPGRDWAQSGENIQDAKTPEKIEKEVHAHFSRHHPVQDIQAVLHELLGRIKTS